MDDPPRAYRSDGLPGASLTPASVISTRGFFPQDTGRAQPSSLNLYWSLTVTLSCMDALTIRLSEAQAEVVARAAEREGRSRGAVIRRAIDALGHDADARDSEFLSGHVDLAGALRAFLEDQGVDVDRSLASVEASHEDEKVRVRMGVDGAIEVARALRRAERALLFESRGFSSGATGFTSERLREARERAGLLSEALAEACCHDGELIRIARES